MTFITASARHHCLDDHPVNHADHVRHELVCHLDDLEARLRRLEQSSKVTQCSAVDALLSTEVKRYGRLVDQTRVGLTMSPNGKLVEVGSTIRTIFGLIAGLEGACEWHSPPSQSSLGFDRGLLPVGTDHDYQRDRCAVVAAYETEWLRQCVDGPADLRALAFSSGMAALSTVLAVLTAETIGPIIVPTAIYHESRYLIERGPLAGRARWIDDATSTRLVDAAVACEAGVVVTDSQFNNRDLGLLDVDDLLDRAGKVGRPMTVVVDTTMSSVRCQPFVTPWPMVRVLTVNSLTKFAQLGLDRVAAGMVIADTHTGNRVDMWREHLGTNLSQVAVRHLPRPCRDLLESRLSRHERNASLLAARLHRWLDRSGIAVIYPGLASHRSNHVAVEARSAGVLIGLVGFEAGQFGEIVSKSISNARTVGVALAEGTSFGFDTTRLSAITLGRPGEIGARGLLRIAVGAGSEHEALEVADAIGAACTRFEDRQRPVGGPAVNDLRNEVVGARA